MSSLFMAALLAASGNAAAQTYSFTDLGTLGGTMSGAADINNAAQIVGYSYIAGDTAAHATLWSGGSITDLGTLGGTNSYANAINNSGRIVGTSYLAGDTGSRATLWSGGSITNLGTVGTNSSYATDINEAGKVVGAYQIGFSSQPLLWSGGSITALSVPGNGLISGTATAINNGGLIVGTSTTMFNDNYAATAWTGGVPTVQAGVIDSFAYGVNNAGQIVGTSGHNPIFNGEATLWNGSGGAPILLGGLFANDQGRYAGSANDINSSGLIVGSSATSDCCDWHAVLWQGTKAVDLNSFLDAASASAGWVLTSATGVNDGGWIVGTAHNSLTGESHAFLLSPERTSSVLSASMPSPVPEPQSYALMLAGLLLTAGMARRARR